MHNRPIDALARELPPWRRHRQARRWAQIIRFGVASGGHLGNQATAHSGYRASRNSEGNDPA